MPPSGRFFTREARVPYQFYSQFLSVRSGMLNDPRLSNDAWRLLLLYMEDKAGGSRLLKWFQDQASEALDVSARRVDDLLFDEILARHPGYAPDPECGEEHFRIADAPRRDFLRVHTWLLALGLPTWVLRVLFMVVDRHGERGWRDVNLTTLTRRIRGHIPRGTFGRKDTSTGSRRRLVRRAVERLAAAGLLLDLRWPPGGAGRCRINWPLIEEGARPEGEEARREVEGSLAGGWTGSHVNQGPDARDPSAYQGWPAAYQVGEQGGDGGGDRPVRREIPSSRRSRHPGLLPGGKDSEGLTALRAVDPYGRLDDQDLGVLASHADACSIAYRGAAETDEWSPILPPDSGRSVGDGQSDGLLTAAESDLLASWADACAIAYREGPAGSTLPPRPLSRPPVAPPHVPAEAGPVAAGRRRDQPADALSLPRETLEAPRAVPEPSALPCAKEGPFRHAGVGRLDGQADSSDANVVDAIPAWIDPDLCGDGSYADDLDEDFGDMERYRVELRARFVPGR